MKTRILLLFVSSCVWRALAAPAADRPDFDAAIQKAALEYVQRVDAATRELVEQREQIARERTPLAQAIHQAEDRVVELTSTLARLGNAQAKFEATRQQAQAELDALTRNLVYLANLGAEAVKDLEAGLLPGEAPFYAPYTDALKLRLEKAAPPDDALAAIDVAEICLERLQRQLGGYAAPGSSLVGDDPHLVPGTYAFVGPTVFFQATATGAVGLVRQREASPHTSTRVLPDWNGGRAGALFRGERGTMLADATGGRALRLRELRGSFWNTLQKGGYVGYGILALGGLSLLLVILKLADIRQLQVDDTPAARAVTGALSRGALDEAQAAVCALKATTRELFATGLRHLGDPRAILEDHLEGFVLRQRLHHERRLPLLAVIATAGPLLGLLGTVTGMIKTFTLITVFGTGSAGKLSGGISEALVATELGLAVAIPTLVIHGFLSHRIQKQLATLERHAGEFATATHEARAAVAEEKSALA